MKNRSYRPYEKKQASKASAIIFMTGVLALLCTMTIVLAITIPGISRRLGNLPFYAQNYYRKLIPHPDYLPTPAPIVSLGAQPAAVALPEVKAPALAATATPTPTVAPPPETIALPAPEIVPIQPVAPQTRLAGFNQQWQTWNNCGPATVTMNTSYFGTTETQVEAAQFLKPNKNDKNVSPPELAAYVQTLGLEVMVRQGGTVAQLKQFLSNGLPVLVETWLIHDGDGMGHYRLLTGYDDAAAQFITLDSLNGPDYPVSYEQFDTDWRVFNRLYLVVYPAERAALVGTLIGADMDETAMYQRLVVQARQDTEANPADAIAYFNQGEALTRLHRYDEAVAAFDHARRLGLHWRRLWYQFTPFEAYYAVGRYQDVLDLTAATIDGTGGLEEAYYYRGLALQATGQTGPKEAFEAALAYNPNYAPAHKALDSMTNNQ
jgi:tetratricopeptide (TPR) repeat protein